MNGLRLLTFATVMGWMSLGTWASQNVVVVLDDSGSMNDSMSWKGPQKIEAAKTALLKVLMQLPPDAQVGILALNANQAGDHWLVPLGPIDVSATRAAIAPLQAEGGTPLGAFLRIAADALLAQRKKQVYGTYRLLIVTDGEANDPELVDLVLPQIMGSGLVVDVIGVNLKQDHSLAQDVHSYRSADDPASLEVAIREVFAESSDGAGDAVESDFALLAGLPDEIAKVAIQTMTRTGRDALLPHVSDGNEAADEVGIAPGGVSPPVPPGPPPVGDGAGSLVTILILVMIVVAVLLRRRIF